MTNYSKKDIELAYLRGKSKRYADTKVTNDIKEFIENAINLDVTHKEKVYIFLNGVPKCSECDNITTFRSFKDGYNEFCSVSCQVKNKKKSQEQSLYNNIQKKVNNLSLKEIVQGLYDGTLKIQKWRKIEKLEEYKKLKSIEQLYKHVILGENQICKYCNTSFNINQNKERRNCVCLTEQEKQIIDLSTLNKKNFLEKLIQNKLHYYSSTKPLIKEEYYKKFPKRSENFLEQINLDAKELNIPFFGYHSSVSYKEIEVLEFVKTIYDGPILQNTKVNGIEIDIFIPDKNIGIEFNGLYWHSSVFKEKNYHLHKTEICENNDIQLLHVYEDQWDYKKDIIKSIISSKLGVSKRIFARKCVIKQVSSKESNLFLENNHIQGKDNSPIRVGLYHNNKLVQLITFKRSHRSKNKYMELKRFCTSLNITVVGGFSKLLKYTQSTLKEDIITFADRSFSNKENTYSKNGFEFLDYTGPNYFYIVGGKRESREKYQKHKLKNILRTFDDSLTEKENMENNKIYRIYDSGNYKYIHRF